MYTVFIHSEIDGFLLFTVGPLLLSVKGIIDLAQMPPTILLPHPGGTGTPTLERIAYLPGAQPPFPPRAFNPTSISPGEDPSLPHSYTCVPLNFPATISVCLHASLGVQPCTDPGCQRSVLPVQSLLSLPAITPGGVFIQTSLTVQQYDFFPFYRKNLYSIPANFLMFELQILIYTLRELQSCFFYSAYFVMSCFNFVFNVC